MLKFVHADSNKELLWHRWPFVYLHGQAESMNYAAFNEGGEPPDICMANVPMDEFVPCIENGLPCKSWQGTMSIPCMVNDQPAVCVLSQKANGLFRGRIALANDFHALQHVLLPNNWR